MSDAQVPRRFLLILFVLGGIATIADLLLVEHHADAWQLAPLVLLGVAVASAAWCMAQPGLTTVRVFQGAMLLLMIGGCAGMWLHYRGNIEFEQEVSPSLAGVELFWKAVKGATPPSLAPATLIHLGLLGLASTYRHPVLVRRANRISNEGDER